MILKSEQLVLTHLKNVHHSRSTCVSLVCTKIAWNHLQSADISTSRRNKQNYLELSYTSYDGNSNLPPLVILHGLLGSKLNWKSLSKTISKRSQRQIITLDARNHGDSPHSDVVNYESMSADVENFILTHKLPQIVLVGHSMGGKTAMTTALTKPDLVRSLVVVDASPVPLILEDPSSAHIVKLLATMKSAIKALPSKNMTLTEARRFCDQYIAKDFPDTALRQFVLTNLLQSDTGEAFWKVNVSALEKNYPSILSYTLPKKQFSKSTIFICGAESTYVRDSDKEAIATYFPKAQVVNIKGAGHWVHADKPEEFVSILLEFLKNDQSEP